MVKITFLRLLLACLFFGLLLFSGQKPSFAETTAFRSATNITTYGNPDFINLSNCSATDGLTCDRPLASSFGNIYFQNFGDFGIPQGAVTTKVKVRITGKTSATLTLYVSLGAIPTGSCLPSIYQYTWNTTSLIGSSIKTMETNADIFGGQLHCLNSSNVRSNQFVFILRRSNTVPWSANIDNFEVAFDYIPPVTPTSTPSSPPGPSPFLELPWDYEEEGLSFNEAVLAINSYFDHEYPLLSTSLGEPQQSSTEIIDFRGPPKNRSSYSSHDGYDYGLIAGAKMGAAVLAAAGGKAKYMNSCGACGNAILIDHGNGFQTRYYHLQKEGLITTIPGQEIPVSAGQQIGKVGATGNVSPPGDAGAHIHFMVVYDKNDDGNFEDNIPDGIIDPFGWQSKEPDPWENYSFFYAGAQRTGSKSYYLWKKNLDGKEAIVGLEGGAFQAGRYVISFSPGSTPIQFNLDMLSSPVASSSAGLTSVGSTMSIFANDLLGNPITEFLTDFTIDIDFSQFDLSRFNTSTLSIYSSTDGTHWTKEETALDMDAKKATAHVNHLTLFALMAQRKDSIAPVTNAVLLGQQGEENWYKSDVSVSLSALDNEGGLGVDYTMHRRDKTEWEIYKDPILFSEEGKHMVEFYSVDKDGNVEEVKSVEFFIDKTSPEIEIVFNPASELLDIVGVDGIESVVLTKTQIRKKKHSLAVKDKAGNSLIVNIEFTDEKRKEAIRIESLSYNEIKTVLSANLFKVAHQNDKKTGKLKFEQSYYYKNVAKVNIEYDPKKEIAKIFEYDNTKTKTRKEREGVVLLKLYTEKGTLKYSY